MNRKDIKMLIIFVCSNEVSYVTQQEIYAKKNRNFLEQKPQSQRRQSFTVVN